MADPVDFENKSERTCGCSKCSIFYRVMTSWQKILPLLSQYSFIKEVTAKDQFLQIYNSAISCPLYKNGRQQEVKKTTLEIEKLLEAVGNRKRVVLGTLQSNTTNTQNKWNAGIKLRLS